MLVTHHVEEIPVGFTHVLLLRGGQVVAAGPLHDTMTEAALSETFGVGAAARLSRRPVRRPRAAEIAAYDRVMAAWLVWTLVAAVCAGAEALTLTLVLGFVAVAAVVALVVAVVGGPVAVQLVRLHRRLDRARRGGQADREVAPADAGRAAAAAPTRLSARVRWFSRRSTHITGQVKIGGEVWTARAYMEDQVLEPGTSVDVVKIQGATALVYGTE